MPGRLRVSAHYRKRCSTHLLQATHTARPSRRLLSATEPGSRRAGHAVCLRLWWLGRFRIRIARRQRQITLLRSRQCRPSRQRDGFGLSSSPMRSLTASFSDFSARAFTSQPRLFRSRGRASLPKRMTPNKGAAANCSARHGTCSPQTHRAGAAPRSAVAELESLGVARVIP